MQVTGGSNPYEIYRFGFGYVNTIQKQRAVSSAPNQITASNNRDPTIQAYEQIKRIRKAVQAIKPILLEPEDDQVGVHVADVTDLIVESIVDENSEKPWEIQASEATPVTAANGRMLTTLVKNMANAMNTLFDDSVFDGSPSAFLESVRNDIRSTVSANFGSEGSQFNTGFGINFNFSNKDGKVFNFSPHEQHRVETTIATQEGAASVRNALFGTESQGLFNQLHDTLTAAGSGLESEVDSIGLFVDVSI